jgi:Fic/DOC family
MEYVGYQHLIDRLGLRLLPLRCPAQIRAVTRIERLDRVLAIPTRLAPQDTLLEHLLFALKHEGTELAVLAAAFRHIDPAELMLELRRTPSGAYIRVLCYLWEWLTGRQFEDLPAAVSGRAHALFDPVRYLTSGHSRRDPRWHVINNALGDARYCPSIRRTEELEALIAQNPLEQVLDYLKGVPPQTLDRVLAWAYLHETQSSYEIEREHPSSSKTEAFASLLRQVQEHRELDEEYLTQLQNAAVTNDFVREGSYRQFQNYLTDGAHGAVGVTYVPPAPALAHDMMQSLYRLAHGEQTPGLDPLARAAMVSFGFVFIHPFGDGNGRLSRFLAHYTLARTGALPNGTILPLSIAMKRNETSYLRALQDFSSPVRRLWDVHWIDASDYSFTFNGDEAVYRYWDATAATTFVYQMALETLRHDLRAEVRYLGSYDMVVRAVNERFDIQGPLLTTLVRMAYQNGGSLSKHRRKQYEDRVDPNVMDYIDEQMTSMKAGTDVP